MNRISNCSRNFASTFKLNQNFSFSFTPRKDNDAVEKGVGVIKKTCRLEAAELKSRSLIRVSGPDSIPFLQGLITNDINHLETKPAVFTLFLNQQGRVLYDAILYSRKSGGSGGKSEEETLIECDSSIKSSLLKHLKIFRVRKKVDINDASEDAGGLKLNVWVVFDPAHKYVNLTHSFSNEIQNLDKIEHMSNRRVLEEETCCRPILTHSSKREDLPLDHGIEAIGDPRLAELGWRVLLPSDNQQKFPSGDISTTTEVNYRQLRYALGVGEGTTDLPPGNCFPLESNGDYLHGISFQKGCYIGQELTARTYHTGVVRKRLMPFWLPTDATLPKEFDPSTSEIVDSKGKSVGKVRGICRPNGIVLTRIEQALNAPELKLGSHTAVTLKKPLWWAVEAPKESQSGKK